MILYISIFVLITIIYFYSYQKNPKDIRILLFCMSFLGLFVGLSDMLGGYDRYIYAELFDITADEIKDGKNPLKTMVIDYYTSEWGYGLFNIIISLFTRNRYIFIFIATLVIYVLLLVSFKKYMENYAYAVLLFLGLWFFFTFTYLRQVMGVTIAWLSIQYVVDRKRWQFFGVILIAFLFHNSALIFAPLYFVPIKKYEMRQVAIVMTVCLLMGMFNISSALFGGYSDIMGGEERVDAYAADASGFRIAYFIEAAFFLAYIFYNYRKIPEKPLNVVLLNMGLIFCAILLLFVRSENGGRLAWYYMIGIIATVTTLSTNIRKITYSGLLMLLVVFFLYYRVLNAWGDTGILYPYKTFFTTGIAGDEWVYNDYEYDHNYRGNKFYR